MPHSYQIINPTLKDNIPIVVDMMNYIHKGKPGALSPYVVYPIVDRHNQPQQYVLTLGALGLQDTSPQNHQPIIAIIEPTTATSGGFGHLLQVTKIIKNLYEQAEFDDSVRGVVKKILVDKTQSSGKPNAAIRAIYREHYIASQKPELGVRYDLLEVKSGFYMYMDKVPGKTLDQYFGKLDILQFLTLSCALLKEFIKHRDQVIATGKHQGKHIVHRDLKVDNILAEFLSDGSCRVGFVDWGLAKAIHQEYKSPRIAGFILSYDPEMLKQNANKEPILFNAQTDLYALYLSILNLAGSNFRTENAEAPLQEQGPDLNQLFEHLVIPSELKSVLNELFRRMFLPDRAKRPTAEGALKCFAWLQSQISLLQPEDSSVLVMTPKSSKQKVISIRTLKNWVKKNLYQIIVNSEQSAINALRLCIQEYRILLSQLEEHDRKEFFQLFSENKLTIACPIMYDLLRFDLIAEYNDDACARLLLRHYELVAPISKTVAKDWEERIFKLKRMLPLQITDVHKSDCLEIGVYIQNIDRLYNEAQPKLHKTEMLHGLKQMLTEHLKLELEVFVANSSELAKTFNRLFEHHSSHSAKDEEVTTNTLTP